MSSAGGLLDVLKQKMQQSKDELEKYKEESENMARNYQEESRRREDAENEVASLNRKITLLEEDLERSEERFPLCPTLHPSLQLRRGVNSYNISLLTSHLFLF